MSGGLPRFRVFRAENYLNETWIVHRDGQQYALLDSEDAAKALVCEELGDFDEADKWQLRADIKRILKSTIQEIEAERAGKK